MQKTVSEVIKTWYFPYPAFLSAGQWGGNSPPGHTADLYQLCLTYSDIHDQLTIDFQSPRTQSFFTIGVLC